MSNLLIFVCQFLVVLLLGVQSLAVRDSNRIIATVISFMIGVNGWYLTTTLGKLPVGDWLTVPWWCYVVAGPMAINVSISLYPILNRMSHNIKLRTNSLWQSMRR